MRSFVKGQLLLDCLGLAFEKESVEDVNDYHDQTFPEEEREDILSGCILPDEEGAEECAESIRSKDAKYADRADKKDLMVREPDIGKFVGPTYHKTEPQRAKEGPQVHKGNMNIDE